MYDRGRNCYKRQKISALGMDVECDSIRDGWEPSNKNTSLTTSATRWGSNRSSTPACKGPNTSSADHPGRTGPVSSNCILAKYADVEDIPGVRLILDMKRGSRISDPESSISLALINLITVDNPNFSPSSSDSESWR